MTNRLPPGKVPWDMVAGVASRKLPPEVVLGPAAGEDAALVRIGGELWAVASDPISFSARDAGTLAVTVNANDVAVRGARPSLFLAVVLVSPNEATPDRINEILGQVDAACEDLEVALIGGHTEVSPGLDHSIVVGTMLGRVTGRPITTGGLKGGDWLGMTRWAGLEGTSILLADFGDRLASVPGMEDLDAVDRVLRGDWLSVVPEALEAAANPAVTALHDVTEGGVGEAVFEMERAAGQGLEIWADQIPVLDQTRALCGALGIDPLGLIGSGSLLVGCRDEGRLSLETQLADLSVPLTWIGRATTRGDATSRPVPRFERDELLKAFVASNVEAVIFDMDGTLVDSEYDWPVIREQLGVTGRSIIDDLNGLPEPARSARWTELEAIERTASDNALLKDGVADLLKLLADRGLTTALVTNNNEENTALLLQRFHLEFDLVLTRDTGLWKPSGAPVAEAIRRLGVAPENCMAVGDSRYDAEAGREARCGVVCLLYEGAEHYDGTVDLRFADVRALTRHLHLVL